MFRGEERRFTSAHAIAIAALFFALGGGAYAAVSSLPPNSVGTKQLRDGSVTAAKLSKGTIKEILKIVKRHSFRPPPPYSIGPAGPPGPKGEQGEAGPPGPSDLYVSGRQSGTLTNEMTELASTSVPPGQYLIQAKANLSAQAAETAGEAICFIASSSESLGSEWDSARTYFPAPISASSEGEVFLSGVASFETVSPVRLFCGGSETLGYDSARVWAIKLGSLHQS